MEEEIQEKLQEYYKDIKIEVAYVTIKTYQIKIIKNIYSIEEISKYNGIMKKSVTFEYKWGDLWTFSSNIEQLKSIIDKYFKLYLERSEDNG